MLMGLPFRTHRDGGEDNENKDTRIKFWLQVYASMEYVCEKISKGIGFEVVDQGCGDLNSPVLKFSIRCPLDPIWTEGVATEDDDHVIESAIEVMKKTIAHAKDENKGELKKCVIKYEFDESNRAVWFRIAMYFGVKPRL